MQRLGFASVDDYRLYKNAYLKRLARNGLEVDTDIFDLNRPKLKLKNLNLNSIDTRTIID